MFNLKTVLKSNKNGIKIILFLLLLGILIGFLLYKKIDSQELEKEIAKIGTYLSTNKINYLLPHFITLCILIISSLAIVGLVLFPIYIIYEGVCIAFNSLALTSVYHLKGFLYSIFYNFITKAVFLILLIFIFKNSIKIIKTYILKRNEKNEKKEEIAKHLKAILHFSIAILINDILIYLFASKILYALSFIIS